MADFAQIRRAYRITSWISLAALIVVVVLILRKSPAPHVPYDPNAAAKVEQEFVAAGQAADAGQPVQVQVDRTELNSYLKQNLQLEGSNSDDSGAAPEPPAGKSESATLSPPGSAAATPAANMPTPLADEQTSIEQVQSSVKDVKVDMDGDLVKAYVIFDYHGKDLSLELDGHLGAQDGFVKFDPVAGKLGSLPLPMSTLQSAVEKMMSSPENREKLRLPSDINDISIANGQAVISYK